MEIEKLEEILLTISYKDENKDNADLAFNKLYWEYSKFVKALVKKNLYNIGAKDEQFVDAVVNNTFVSIYENPLKFSIPQDEFSKTDISFKAWVSRIAKNEIHDLLKDFKILESVLPESNNETAFEDTLIDAEKNNIYVENLNAKILEDALNTLPERDREILRALYLYHEVGKNTPTKVLNELCNFFGTTKPNIRQIKVRSEKKIIEYFSKYSQLKPLKYAKG